MTLAILPAVLQTGVTLTTSSAAMVTAPAVTMVKVNTIVFSNVSGSTASTITVTRVNAGGTPVTVINSTTIGPNQSLVPKELIGMVLNPGEHINALASVASTINCTASGFTITQ